MVLGLTGPTGAGKSTVCRWLAFQIKGISIIDADKVAREVVKPDSPCLADLAAAFSKSILLPDGTLDRRKLGQLVFSSKESLAELNRITLPYILEDIRDMIERGEKAGRPLIVMDAPTLFESGADSMCGYTASVLAPWEERLERILHRDGLTREEVENRMRSQPADDFYRGRSDFIIENGQGSGLLDTQLKELLQKLTVQRGK